jgi:hypothetical protein
MPDAGVWVEISDGNIRNGHIYLRHVLNFFPADAIGGSNAGSASLKTIDVTFEPGSTIKSDIAGDKRFLRERGAVREFFEKSRAKSGDRVLISKIGPRKFRFELVRT